MIVDKEFKTLIPPLTRDIPFLAQDKVYEGSNGLHFYQIWPSKKHSGYFYVYQSILNKNKTGEAIYSKRPFNENAVKEWVKGKVKKNTKWHVSKWNGCEYSYLIAVCIHKDEGGGKRNKAKTTFIYFIKGEGSEFVKIGKSDDIEYRIKTLQAGCPFLLKCICFYEAKSQEEHRLHKLFKKDHYRGEWFYLSANIINFIKNKTKEKESKK